MNHSVKKLVTGAALVFAAFGAIAADPIKIGSVLSVTGPAAFLGDPELKTLQLYVADTLRCKLWAHLESNQAPTDYESVALTE